MTSFHLAVWIPPVVVGGLGLIAMTVRYLMLLLGLLVALSKAAQSDRPVIFQAFAWAMRYECKGGHSEIFRSSQKAPSTKKDARRSGKVTSRL